MKEKIKKLSLPAVILIASIILGGFYFTTQIIKQQSIEKQQNRNYIAERKDNCYNLFYKEREKWSNVEKFWYDESTDKCIVQYSKIEKDYDISREECEDPLNALTHRYRPYLGRMEYESYCEITSYFTKEF